MSSFFVYIFWSFYAFIGQRHLRYNRKLQEREPRNDMQQRHYCQHCQNQLHSAAIDIVLPLLYLLLRLLPVLLPLLSLPDHYTTTVNLSFSLCLSCIIITSSNYIQSRRAKHLLIPESIMTLFSNLNPQRWRPQVTYCISLLV